jgi:hypothetical protein
MHQTRSRVKDPPLLRWQALLHGYRYILQTGTRPTPGRQPHRQEAGCHPTAKVPSRCLLSRASARRASSLPAAATSSAVVVAAAAAKGPPGPAGGGGGAKATAWRAAVAPGITARRPAVRSVRQRLLSARAAYPRARASPLHSKCVIMCMGRATELAAGGQGIPWSCISSSSFSY